MFSNKIAECTPKYWEENLFRIWMSHWLFLGSCDYLVIVAGLPVLDDSRRGKYMSFSCSQEYDVT